MSLVTGDPEEDDRLLLESLERNLQRFDKMADLEIKRLNGNDEPLLDSSGSVTQPSSISFWRATKGWVADGLPRIRFQQAVTHLLQSVSQLFSKPPGE